MSTPNNIGPQAAANRAKLSKENKVVFDWWVEKIIIAEDAIIFSSMLQGLACMYPQSDYWTLARAVMKIASSEEFEAIYETVHEHAKKNMSS